MLLLVNPFVAFWICVFNWLRSKFHPPLCWILGPASWQDIVTGGVDLFLQVKKWWDVILCIDGAGIFICLNICFLLIVLKFQFRKKNKLAILLWSCLALTCNTNNHVGWRSASIWCPRYFPCYIFVVTAHQLCCWLYSYFVPFLFMQEGMISHVFMAVGIKSYEPDCSERWVSSVFNYFFYCSTWAWV